MYIFIAFGNIGVVRWQIIRRICPIILLFVFSCTLAAKPLQIIIVTSNNNSEIGYSEFLQEIYMDNADVEVDDDRYKEPLREVEKRQLS